MHSVNLETISFDCIISQAFINAEMYLVKTIYVTICFLLYRQCVVFLVSFL